MTDGVPVAMPSLVLAAKLLRRAQRGGSTSAGIRRSTGASATVSLRRSKINGLRGPHYSRSLRGR